VKEEVGRMRDFQTKGYFLQKLYDLQPSPTIIRVIKSRRIRCAEDVACVGYWSGAYRELVG
jgi:hypothetical protein